MVKNTTGGTKTKGLARKHVNAAGGGSKLKIPEDELEVIVYVNAMLGNGMCEVFNNEGIRFIAHIRNKFKGRHKRSNLITKNSLILCGYRDWENPYKNLDVIFIYDDNNIKALRNIPNIQIQTLLLRIDSPLHHNTHDNLTAHIFHDNDNYNTHDYDNDNDNDNDHKLLQLHTNNNNTHDYDYDDI